MKKMIALLLTMLVVFAAAGCGAAQNDYDAQTITVKNGAVKIFLALLTLAHGVVRHGQRSFGLIHIGFDRKRPLGRLDHLLPLTGGNVSMRKIVPCNRIFIIQLQGAFQTVNRPFKFSFSSVQVSQI